VEISWKKFALFFEHASSSVAPTISMIFSRCFSPKFLQDQCKQTCSNITKSSMGRANEITTTGTLDCISWVQLGTESRFILFIDWIKLSFTKTELFFGIKLRNIYKCVCATSPQIISLACCMRGCLIWEVSFWMFHLSFFA
jgi:hypothetical protein